ncbi:GH24744 [Drosophila grimshawi]|uniref:GH24744 n=1 Tax=Drosophila grimshawi TaxID=7222 RepID=B4JN44_DROGR|nr:GH24744 [Drosophila grimshawi]
MLADQQSLAQLICLERLANLEVALRHDLRMFRPAAAVCLIKLDENPVWMQLDDDDDDDDGPLSRWANSERTNAKDKYTFYYYGYYYHKR